MLIEAPELSSFTRLRHAFFTRQGGVSKGLYASLNGGIGSQDDRTDVVENRRRMAEAVGVAPPHLLSLHQIHSPDAIVVNEPWGAERPRADGMATNRPGLALAIATAAEIGRRGLALGDDVSVIGFDDTPTARALGLASVRQPIDEVADECIADLVRQLRGDDGEAAGRILTPELVLRPSVRPHRSSE